jgi:hypothetical protein
VTPDDLKEELEKALPCSASPRFPCTNVKQEHWCGECKARAAVTPILERLVAERKHPDECFEAYEQLQAKLAAAEEDLEKLAEAEAEADDLRAKLTAAVSLLAQRSHVAQDESGLVTITGFQHDQDTCARLGGACAE